MLDRINERPKDRILEVMNLFRSDPREHKIDLGVGVYRNAEGVTPVMRAVKTAERKLWERQETKVYTGLAGDPAFAEAMRSLVLGDAVDPLRVAAAATPGGTGAVRQAFELVRVENPGATVWVSNPTWPNHVSILHHLGIKMREYRYFDGDTRSVDFPGMMEDLAALGAGDVVLLHGCCHNPTGADLKPAEWQAVADHIATIGATPMIDIAYQGFGDGVEEDAVGLRTVVRSCSEALVAASCSKNFGIYRERTGLLIGVAPRADRRSGVQAALNHLNRQNFSFPPDHGARIVTEILVDSGLRAEWMSELEEMRLCMLGLRERLASELQRVTGSNRFGFIAEHRGMFSRLGVSPERVERMRERHGVYMIGDSRMNIAGLNDDTLPIVAQAIAETCT